MTNLELAKKNLWKVFLVFTAGMLAAIAWLALFEGGTTASARELSGDWMTQTAVTVTAQTVSPTETLYLPLISRPTTKMSLGAVTILNGPVQCSGGSSGDCYTIRVTCPGVSSTLDAIIKFGIPLTSTLSGTVMFYGGYDGMYFWESIPVTNTAIISDVRTAGFSTVQIDWLNRWFLTSTGNMAGMDGVACRSATVARWVYDTFHQADQSAPYCLVGHSNGATQVAYSLSHYGLDEIVDEAILESGPNFSLLEHGCINSQAYASLFEPKTPDRRWIDETFGVTATNGPCENTNSADPLKSQWRPLWQEASIVTNHTLNYYPTTMVSMIFGSLDNSPTKYHAVEFANWLSLGGTPHFTSTIIQGGLHGTTRSPAGKIKMTSEIINGCVIR
jgi:hypothetical protein